MLLIHFKYLHISTAEPKQKGIPCFLKNKMFTITSVWDILKSVFEIKTFYWAGYFSGKAEEPLNQNKRFKNQLYAWGTLKLKQAQGLCLFYILNQLKSPFLSFLNFFSYILPRFYQNMSCIVIIKFKTCRIKSFQSEY